MTPEEKTAKKREQIRNKKAAERKTGRKKKSAGKLQGLFVLVLIAVLIGVFFTGRIPADFDLSAMQKTGDPDAEAPDIQGEAAELYIVNIEEPVYQKNADEKIDPYSITKILTCYLAIENLDMDQIVTVSEYAATPLEDGTTIFLEAGEKMSVRDLLYGAMLESGNDAATALGEAVSGSEKAFAKLMNEQAAEWGCTNTHFVNANGWKDKNHYTTAHDMALITARSFENETLREIAMTREYVIGPTNMKGERYLESHTLRGTQIEYITGGKTGGWTSSDSSIAVAFSKDGLDGAAVVLRTKVKNRKPEASKLIAFSKEVTPGFIVAEPGTVICESMVKGGSRNKVKLCSDETIYAYPKGQDEKGVRMEIERTDLEAPVTAGEKAGTYTLYVDDREIQTGDLYAAEDIEKGWILSKLYVPDKTGALLCVFLVLWVILFALARRMPGTGHGRKASKKDAQKP